MGSELRGGTEYRREHHVRRLDNGMYAVQVEKYGSVLVPADVATVIAYRLSTQHHARENASTPSERRAFEEAQNTNCHGAVAEICGVRGGTPDIRSGRVIQDALPEPSTPDSYAQLRTELTHTRPLPAIVQITFHGICIHSFVYLGVSTSGEHLVYEKVNKGFKNPWHVTTLQDVHARHAVGEYAFDSLQRVREKMNAH